MTDKEIQQKFKELIYDLGEIDFDAINTDFWNKHINKDEDFNEKQMQYFREFLFGENLKKLPT